jgi:hypothetical protein
MMMKPYGHRLSTRFSSACARETKLSGSSEAVQADRGDREERRSAAHKLSRLVGSVVRLGCYYRSAALAGTAPDSRRDVPARHGRAIGSPYIGARISRDVVSQASQNAIGYIRPVGITYLLFP